MQEVYIRANVMHQLVALCVLMAEQTDLRICTSLVKKQTFVSVIRAFVACHFADICFSSRMPYAEIWTQYIPA